GQCRRYEKRAFAPDTRHTDRTWTRALCAGRGSRLDVGALSRHLDGGALDGHQAGGVDDRPGDALGVGGVEDALNVGVEVEGRQPGVALPGAPAVHLDGGHDGGDLVEGHGGLRWWATWGRGGPGGPARRS